MKCNDLQRKIKHSLQIILSFFVDILKIIIINNNTVKLRNYLDKFVVILQWTGTLPWGEYVVLVYDIEVIYGNK